MSTSVPAVADASMVEGIEKKLTQIKEEVAAAEKKVAAAEKKVAAAKEEVAAAEKKVAAAEKKVAVAKEEVAAEKKVAAAKDKTQEEQDTTQKLLNIALRTLESAQLGMETAQKGLATSEEERESHVSVLHALNHSLNQLRLGNLQDSQGAGATQTGTRKPFRVHGHGSSAHLWLKVQTPPLIVWSSSQWLPFMPCLCCCVLVGHDWVHTTRCRLVNLSFCLDKCSGML
jgi:Zn-dependent metalloprotease